MLNKRKLKPGDQPVALADGDVLTVGDATFKFFGSVKVRPRRIPAYGDLLPPRAGAQHAMQNGAGAVNRFAFVFQV